jgi:hypothetical protein
MCLQEENNHGKLISVCSRTKLNKRWYQRLVVDFLDRERTK